MTRVGTVSALARFPVKSMGGERLQRAPLTLQGILGDRWFAFVQAGSTSSFPWLTARQVPSMLAYTASIASERPLTVAITTPTGETLEPANGRLKTQLTASLGADIVLLQDYRGSFDVAPVSLITRATLGELERSSGVSDLEGRLRMNVVIDGPADPFAEGAWVGKTVRLGPDARVTITEPDGRCMMTNLEPGTGASDPRVLRTIAERNGANAGVYAVAITAGIVSVGDEVVLED